MKKIMDLFTLEDLMSFLEASETPRPVTIRTNSLKTRRRDLAQVDIFYFYYIKMYDISIRITMLFFKNF